MMAIRMVQGPESKCMYFDPLKLCCNQASSSLSLYILYYTRTSSLHTPLLSQICGVADASQGSFSSYAYILMVIHYLQRTSPPVVPVLQLVRCTNRHCTLLQ